MTNKYRFYFGPEDGPDNEDGPQPDDNMTFGVPVDGYGD